MIDWIIKKNKFLKNIFNKIKQDISDIRLSNLKLQESFNSLALTQENTISKEEVKELINQSLREQLREVTPRSNYSK